MIHIIANPYYDNFCEFLCHLHAYKSMTEGARWSRDYLLGLCRRDRSYACFRAGRMVFGGHEHEFEGMPDAVKTGSICCAGCHSC